MKVGLSIKFVFEDDIRNFGDLVAGFLQHQGLNYSFCQSNKGTIVELLTSGQETVTPSLPKRDLFMGAIDQIREMIKPIVSAKQRDSQNIEEVKTILTDLTSDSYENSNYDDLVKEYRLKNNTGPFLSPKVESELKFKARVLESKRWFKDITQAQRRVN